MPCTEVMSVVWESPEPLMHKGVKCEAGSEISLPAFIAKGFVARGMARLPGDTVEPTKPKRKTKAKE